MKSSFSTLKTHICRCNKFCQTAFSSVVGARRITVLLLAFLRGVRDKSGPQCTVGLVALRPSGDTVIRNSVSTL